MIRSFAHPRPFTSLRPFGCYSSAPSLKWADEPIAAFVDGFGMLCLFWGEHMAVRVMAAD
jgi:hypothetical protein